LEGRDAEGNTKKQVMRINRQEKKLKRAEENVNDWTRGNILTQNGEDL
jgi:hypothetical protein